MDNRDLIATLKRDWIDTSEYYEVEYWSNKFGVSVERLKTAVRAVGNLVASVEQFLKK